VASALAAVLGLLVVTPATSAFAVLDPDAPMTAAVRSVAAPSLPVEDLPKALRGKAFDVIPTGEKLVALTFDAGGGAGGARKILRTLKASGIPATFFLTGRWARAFPRKVARIARNGHVLGNHTDTHGKVTSMSGARLRTELRTTENAVRSAAGRGTKPWFRFPYGAHTPDDIRRVNDLGYACIQWTVDTAGWMGTSGGQSVATVVARVMDGLRPGEIVLMHVGQHPTDGSTLDADALPTVIEALRAKGYGFTTLAALNPADTSR
jgi:peptidoglycan/xylan/chitin deacetylase (PgdA/CDA1 family)